MIILLTELLSPRIIPPPRSSPPLFLSTHRLIPPSPTQQRPPSPISIKPSLRIFLIIQIKIQRARRIPRLGEVNRFRRVQPRVPRSAEDRPETEELDSVTGDDEDSVEEFFLSRTGAAGVQEDEDEGEGTEENEG